MAAELSPEEALRIAAETRRSAAPPRVPAWFPPYAGGTFALAMAAIGVSNLSGGDHGAARVFGIAGIVLVVAHLAMYVALVRRWRRGGLIPLGETPTTQFRRRASRWFLIAALGVGGVCFLLGSSGWGIISFGLIAGAENWYRLVGWTRPE